MNVAVAVAANRGGIWLREGMGPLALSLRRTRADARYLIYAAGEGLQYLLNWEMDAFNRGELGT